MYFDNLNKIIDRCMLDSCENGTADYNSSYLEFTTPYDAENERWDQCSAYFHNGQ